VLLISYPVTVKLAPYRDHRQASNKFMTRDVARIVAIRDRLNIIARDKKALFKKIIYDMYQ